MAKRRKPESAGNPLKQVALWQWGLFLIVWGPIGNLLAAFVLKSPAVPVTDAQRGEAFGRGLVTVLCIIAGVVLIILHFVRRNRRP